MNAPLRWKLILGCALIAVLEVPQAVSLVLQDLDGPYTKRASVAVARPSIAVPRTPVRTSVRSPLAVATAAATEAWWSSVSLPSESFGAEFPLSDRVSLGAR